MYKDLSEFVACTEVVIVNEETAVIVVDRYMDTDIRLYGFSTPSEGKTRFEIQEEGYAYLQELTSKINARKR